MAGTSHPADKTSSRTHDRSSFAWRTNGWPIGAPADASPPASLPHDARLGADAVRYSFTGVRPRPAVPTLLAGLPAHRHLNPKRPVWTAPLVKGFFEALRTSRARSCLRPVDAGRMAPLALMIGPHGSSPRSPYRARTGADTCTGFQAFPWVHITSSAPSILIALRRKLLLAEPFAAVRPRSAGRRIGRRGSSARRRCARPCWRPPPRSA